MKIGVLMGGVSSERNISLQSGNAVYQALKSSGNDVEAIDIDTDQPEEIKQILRRHKIDVAFIALHGKMGEDGAIQRILEFMNIAYTGSGVESSHISMNKILSYQVFVENGLPVPDYQVLTDLSELHASQLTLPVVVKPAAEGSSIGISIVKKEDELMPALQHASEFSTQVLIERYIPGREVTVGIVDDKPLPVVEIRPKNEFYDQQSKYEKGMTEYLVPAPIPDQLTQKLQDLAVEAYQALGCRHFARVDFLLDDDENVFILEVNTIPGFTGLSLLPMAAAESGMDFTQLCQTLVGLAYGAKK